MSPELQIQEQINALKQQGFTEQQIIEQLTGSGWDYSMVINALTGKSSSASAGKKGLKKTLLVFLVIILVLVPVGLYFSRQDKQPETAQTATANTNQNQQQSKDVQTNPEMENYVQFNDLEYITFLVSKQWSGKTSRPQAMSVSLYNYDPEMIKAELISDGRYPTGANFYHDIPRRDLKSYPFSLDKMYSVQILTSTLNVRPLTRESVENREREDGIEDLQFYKVNDHTVADYIEMGDERTVDQRIIRMQDEKDTIEVLIVITPSESRNKVTKENFDGLMELVGSIQFRE